MIHRALWGSLFALHPSHVVRSLFRPPFLRSAGPPNRLPQKPDQAPAQPHRERSRLPSLHAPLGQHLFLFYRASSPPSPYVPFPTYPHIQHKLTRYSQCRYIADRACRDIIAYRLLLLGSALTLSCYAWLALPAARMPVDFPALVSFGMGHGFHTRESSESLSPLPFLQIRILNMKCSPSRDRRAPQRHLHHARHA